MRNVRVPVPAELELGVQKKDTIEIRRVDTWLSRDGFEAEADAPRSSADAVVWADVEQRCSGYAIWSTALQLMMNIVGMALSGWAVLALQELVWSRKSESRVLNGT